MFDSIENSGHVQLSGMTLQVMTIQTGTYVRHRREEANLIIGRGNTTSDDHHGLPTQFNQCDGPHDGFSCCWARVNSVLTLR